MDWKLTLERSLFGLAMGIATVFVIPSKLEPLFWVASFVACAVMIARSSSAKHFQQSLLTSLANIKRPAAP